MRDQRDAELYALDPHKRYQLVLPDFLVWVRQHGLKALLVINPGNPTGQLIPLEEMIEFLRQAKDMDLVLVDESFIDFAGDIVPSLLPLADQFPNLLIVRSMSKHCGVPGLRLGYSYSGNQHLLDKLRRFVPTWNLNTLAQYFLSLLAATDATYHEGRKRLIADVRQLYSTLQTVAKIDVYPTGANFVLIKIKNGMTATALQKVLLNDHQMYVRDCTNKIGMDEFHIRVASQGREKDALLVKTLRELLK
jgi:threonine-phosphate decarboxylase